MGRGGEIDSPLAAMRGRSLVCFGEVVEQRVEMADAAAERLVKASDECGPERDDGAGSGGGAAGAGDEHGGAVARVGGTGDIGDSSAAFAGGAEGDAGVALPCGYREVAADSTAGGSGNAVEFIVPDDLFS
jgi:hypothetical protein